MATLVLSAVGSLGGPIGIAVGSLIGKQIDNSLFGSSREGPRLKELAVTTSSYGQPVQRNFGRMRVAGTVIWSSDLVERSSRQGGKGQPSTTVYTYSASFAVALSSTPIARLGRIWADGNLLRGAQGDLKVEGELRVYLGNGNSPADPVIEADQGEDVPAFRDFAYVVFEDLQLADYGNRIPALTFEVFAEDDANVTLDQIAPQALRSEQSNNVRHARGFADDGGAIAASLSAIDQLVPLFCVTNGDGFKLLTAPDRSEGVATLPEQLASIVDAAETERIKQRAESLDRTPTAVRYYDEARDYQPSVQRAVGHRQSGRENMLDLPATMEASGARQLANDNAQRARWHHEKVTWRVAVLDPEIRPGSLVKLPETPGLWIVKTWEWFDRGIELGLERAAPEPGGPIASVAGELIEPADLPIAPTALEFLELPPEGAADASQPQIFAAASSETEAWRGAALFSEQGTSLVSVGSAHSRRVVLAELLEAVASSNSLLLEPSASLLVQCVGDDLLFEPTDVAGLAAGRNRILVGSEVLQFVEAEAISERILRLRGLLRGRGGTEAAAALGHSSGEVVVLLDDRLTRLDPSQVAASQTSRIAAIGRGDQVPVYSTLRNFGASRRPLSPVHPRLANDTAGNLHLCWTRRSRGQWLWEDRVEVPLVEERERYLIGFGPVSDPFSVWESDVPELLLTPEQRADFVSQHGVGAIWVKQIGTFDHSPPLFITDLS